MPHTPTGRARERQDRPLSSPINPAAAVSGSAFPPSASVAGGSWKCRSREVCAPNRVAGVFELETAPSGRASITEAGLKST